ncbi:hypothetical protein P9139_19040 [Curtobacterium flaccumfaciens]|nr:hypothetical protein P9139_19040 [Curtobacterium flaccumfaciens]
MEDSAEASGSTRVDMRSIVIPSTTESAISARTSRSSVTEPPTTSASR